MSKRGYLITVTIEADGVAAHDQRAQALFAATKELACRSVDFANYVRDVKMFDRQTVVDTVFEECLAKATAKFV